MPRAPCRAPFLFVVRVTAERADVAHPRSAAGALPRRADAVVGLLGLRRDPVEGLARGVLRPVGGDPERLGHLGPAPPLPAGLAGLVAAIASAA